MNAPPKVSEREAVLRERRASAKSRCAALHAARVEGGARTISPDHAGYYVGTNPCGDCIAVAALRYPLPLVPRPRVVTLPMPNRDDFSVRKNGDVWEYTFWPVTDDVQWYDLKAELRHNSALLGNLGVVGRAIAAIELEPTELVEDDTPEGHS